MIFDTEALILDRLAAKCAPGTVLVGTFDPVDLTDDASSPVVGQIFLSRIVPTGQTGPHARVELSWSFSVHIDIARATPAQKTAASDLLQAAGNALVDFPASPGRSLQISAGQDSDFDGRVLRLSFGFTLPAHFVGDGT